MPLAFASLRPPLRASLLASALLCACAAAPVHAQYGPVDPLESAVRALKSNVGSSNDGEQLAALGALRELRDPTLTPLLEGYLHGDDWSLRIGSLLGLAELGGGGRVDIDRLEKLPTEADRKAAIGAALSLGLLDAARIERVLAWDDVPSAQRVLLACELRKLGGTPDAAMVAKLAASKSPEVAALAAALLLDMKAEGAQALADGARSAIAALPPGGISNSVAQVAEACSTRELAGAAPFIASLCSLDGLTDDARLRSLGSLLVLSPEAAYPVFAASVERERTQPALMRHAAILLASGVRAPAAEWNRIRNGEPLLETIADAGALLAEGNDRAAFAKLLGTMHRVTFVATTDGVQRSGPSAQREFGSACLALLLEQRKKLTNQRESVMRGVAMLARVAPEELRPALESAADEDDLVEALLLALASAGSPEASAVADTMRGKTSRLGEGLIAVMRARSRDTIDTADLQMLATVAGGGATADRAVQVQAAWLWLRHSGKTADAVAALTAAKEPAR
ncbi:MAG: hypothetical protein LW636_06650 [Planctomycetaceae bacterium]|nr:hypothetical protein [Planctomycetaceae bacterium]